MTGIFILLGILSIAVGSLFMAFKRTCKFNCCNNENVTTVARSKIESVMVTDPGWPGHPAESYYADCILTIEKCSNCGKEWAFRVRADKKEDFEVDYVKVKISQEEPLLKHR